MNEDEDRFAPIGIIKYHPAIPPEERVEIAADIAKDIAQQAGQNCEITDFSGHTVAAAFPTKDGTSSFSMASLGNKYDRIFGHGDFIGNN